MSSIETPGSLERRLKVTVPRQQIHAEVEARLKNLGRTARVDGFRKGKVPYRIMEQQYGPRIHQEVLEDALRDSFFEEVRKSSLKVAGMPEFRAEGSDPDAAQIEYAATFEVYPEIPLGDLASVQVERVTHEVTDADVDAALMTLRRQRTQYQPCQRAARNEDQVRIDFSGKLDGVPFEGGEGKGVGVVLGMGRMLPDFEKAIIGMEAGQTKTFTLTFPEDYHSRNVRGKPVEFTLTLNAVEAPLVPELDKEFASSMGIRDGDVARLREETRNSLIREVARRLKLRNKDSVMGALLKMAPAEVPKALLEAESQIIMRQTLAEMKEQGVTLPKDITLSPGLFADRALQRVRLGLVVGELVRLHELIARPEQIRALVTEYAQGFDHPNEVIKWHYDDPARLKTVESLVLEENVVEWVMGVAKVTDKAIGFEALMEANDDRH